MSAFPNSPQLVKGAIIGIDQDNPISRVIIFQYNPKELRRTINPQMTGEGGGRTEVTRITGAPIETITLGKMEIDATDQLEMGEGSATELGIYPQLSALEMLVYPKINTIRANTALMESGSLEIMPPEAPLTLFFWGSKRVLPVRITSFEVTEEEFDPHLNPIRATLSMSLRVLSYNDLPVDHPGYEIFMAHQADKEAMASMASIEEIGNVLGGGLDIP